MSGNASCNNGQNVIVYSSVQAVNCSNWSAYDYPAMVLTSSGWVQKWFGGLVATGEGSDDIAFWIGWDGNYCDTNRVTYIPPAVPC